MKEVSQCSKESMRTQVDSPESTYSIGTMARAGNPHLFSLCVCACMRFPDRGIYISGYKKNYKFLLAHVIDTQSRYFIYKP